MPEDRWVEPRTRIPLAGIVAMVLIVAVVAVFLKTQFAAIFPPTTIQVTDGMNDLQNTAGRASATYEGLREVPLTRKERLTGVLQRTSGAMRFTLDAPERLLIITREDAKEEILLELRDDGTLGASFEQGGAATRVDIDTLARELTYSQPGTSATPFIVPLGATLAYEGFFTYRNERLLFQYEPSTLSAHINGASLDTVTLTRADDGSLSGSWRRDSVDHRVVIDGVASMATIADIW